MKIQTASLYRMMNYSERNLSLPATIDRLPFLCEKIVLILLTGQMLYLKCNYLCVNWNAELMRDLSRTRYSKGYAWKKLTANGCFCRHSDYLVKKAVTGEYLSISFNQHVSVFYVLGLQLMTRWPGYMLRLLTGGCMRKMGRLTAVTTDTWEARINPDIEGVLFTLILHAVLQIFAELQPGRLSDLQVRHRQRRPRCQDCYMQLGDWGQTVCNVMEKTLE